MTVIKLFFFSAVEMIPYSNALNGGQTHHTGAMNK